LLATELETGLTLAPLLPGEKGLGDEGKPRLAKLWGTYVYTVAQGRGDGGEGDSRFFKPDLVSRAES
ncbi:MAG: hypothetical protein KME17_31215, partial [Cyanosarcina radialis HA8281-LM2]|jgi:hypothetical protein|nr:hypothetical protein [Cyanosarcina radialis HA8281-LM2]